MIYNPYSLEGKTILVTGASSGIGKAIAIECSKLGATVILTARNEVRLKETLDQLEGNGHQTIVADITNEDDRKRLADSIPQIDGFVCNAGITKRKPVSFVKEEELREIFLLTKAIMKAKKINKEGSMVFMASMAAKTVTPGNSMYAASKAAIESFSRSCALEYAAKGIRANAILPGMIETPLIYSGMLSEVEIERDKQHYMLKRYGKPEEIAWAVIFLLSDASKWITSTSLLINGGGRIVKEKD